MALDLADVEPDGGTLAVDGPADVEPDASAECRVELAALDLADGGTLAVDARRFG